MTQLYRFINKIHKLRLEKIQQSDIILHVPKDITEEQLTSLVPESYSDHQLFGDKAYILLSYIFNETIKSEKSSALLLSDYLKAELGDEYKLVLTQLEKGGFIQLTEKFIIGVRPNGYTLTKKYKKYQFKKVKLNSPKQIRKTRRQRVNKAEEQKSLLLEQKELVHLLYSKNLRLDTDAANTYINQLEKRLKLTLKKQHFKHKGDKEEAMEVINHLIEQAKNNIDKFNKTENLLLNLPKVQVRGGRLHTKVSTLMSELRNFITYEGKEQLVYLDISNSQPYHLMLALQPNFWSRRSQSKEAITLKNVDPFLYKKLTDSKNITRYNTILRSLKPVNESVSKPMITRLSEEKRSVKYFCHLVSTGKLYKFTSKEFKSKMPVSTKLHPLRDRSSAKQAFIQMLYSDDKKKVSMSAKLMKVFRKVFPEVAEVITFLKSNSNRDFALLLQQLESEFIINRISLPLLRENPGMPIYTIHDGIVTTAQYTEIVRSKIIETYVKEIGVAPDLKEEKLEAKKAHDGLRNYSSKKAAKIIEEHFKNSVTPAATQQELLQELLQKLKTNSSNKVIAEVPAYIYLPDYSFMM